MQVQLPSSTRPAFAVLEHFVQGKHPDDHRCEDGVVVTNELVAVVDGATSKSAVLFDGQPGGAFACRTLLGLLKQLDVTLPVPHQVQWLSEGLRAAVERVGGRRFEDIAPVDRPCASMIYFLAARRQLVAVGDCQALVDGAPYVFTKEVDAVNANMRAYVLEALLAQGYTEEALRHMDPEPGRQAILPTLKTQMLFQNHPSSRFGYGVMDGSPVPDRFIGVHDLGDPLEVVLASDGYPVLHTSLRASEEALAQALAADPLCIRELRGTKALTPGLRSFDDRAYLRIRCRP